MPHGDPQVQDDRLLLMLQRLLGIRSVDFRATFTEAAAIIAERFAADKVDIYVHQPARNSLVALGTSQTPMGERQVDSATPDFFGERDLRALQAVAAGSS